MASEMIARCASRTEEAKTARARRVLWRRVWAAAREVRRAEIESPANSVVGELAAMLRRAEAREQRRMERRGPKGAGSTVRRGCKSKGRGGGAWRRVMRSRSYQGFHQFLFLAREQLGSTSSGSSAVSKHGTVVFRSPFFAAVVWAPRRSYYVSANSASKHSRKAPQRGDTRTSSINAWARASDEDNSIEPSGFNLLFVRRWCSAANRGLFWRVEMGMGGSMSGYG